MRRFLSACLMTLLLLPAAAHSAAGAKLPLTDDPALRIPQDERIYYMLVDRFHNGDTSNDGAADPANPEARHGGDLRGVISKLEYIKELGFTAINLTPIFKSAASDYLGAEPVDLRSVDPHFGDTALAKKLVEESHMREMKVIFDLPVPQTGQDDLLAISRFWIDETGVDGFRLLGAQALPPAFWQGYVSDLKQQHSRLWLIADLPAATAPADLVAYQESGLAVPDWGFRQAALAVYANGEATALLRDSTFSVLAQWPAPANLGGLLDGPDQQRLAAAVSEVSANMMLALVHLYTHTSVPTVYYGTEIGLTGDTADFPWDTYKYRNPDVYMLIKALNRIRGEHLALRRGTWVELLAEPSQFAFAREYERDRVVVVLNTSASEPFTTGLPVASKLDLPDGTRLFDKLSGKRMQVKNGMIPLDLPPQTAAVLTVEETAGGIYFVVAIGTAFLLVAAVIIIGQRRRAE